jgi:capsular polysaccharide export protein
MTNRVTQGLHGPPFLRIPPFPGARAAALAQAGSCAVDGPELVGLLRRERVGGRFWGPFAVLPPGCTAVLAPDSAAQLRLMLQQEDHRAIAVLAKPDIAVPGGIARIDPTCDLWSLAESAGRVRAGAGQEIALVAALAGTPVVVDGPGTYAGCDVDAAGAAARAIGAWRYVCPFSGDDLTAAQAADLLGDWRRLLDANRATDAVLGVAPWKRTTLDALLWDGTGPVRHRRRIGRGMGRGSRVLAWKSRTPPRVLADVEARGARLGEIEDGFIRSSGLGANCVPPLSAIVDWSGVYFDPAAPSELENLLQEGEIDELLIKRAAMLRARLVQAAISKYAQGAGQAIRPCNDRRRVLVTGQVEDDRSIISGGGSASNLDLLKRARALEPDAWILYKPHPDVEAGHRKGHLSEAEILRHADEIERGPPIARLLDTVDAVHVITSLAGFEGLLRGKAVTTHGVPFYAGWGLTRDLAAVPARRTRRRSLDELVAATLLLYPRYLDPVTGLPCQAEILVNRFESGEIRVKSALITLREWQGRLRLVWQHARGRQR